jgi:hypothetical protein
MAKKGSKKKAGEFILECSVTKAWYFKDKANIYAKGVRRSSIGVKAVVSGWWPVEVANILVLLQTPRQDGHVQHCGTLC